MSDELLIDKDWADALAHSGAPIDYRSPDGETLTLWFEGEQLGRHSRWSISYLHVIRDHRDRLWGTVYLRPATEAQEGQDRWAFTRMVDGVEHVVFRPVESFEEVVTNYRYVP